MNPENPQTDLSLKAEINLYYDLHVPENSSVAAPLLIAVHGYGAHKRYMMREARLVAPAGFAVASLQAPFQHFRQTETGYKTGFGWLTDFKPEESIALHQDFILKLIEKLAADKIIDREKVYLYGFSQACALNFRFAFTNPDCLRAVVGVCGGIPSDLETNPVYAPTNASVFYLHGDDDEFYTLEKFHGYAQKLKNYLPKVKVEPYRAKHEITDEMRADIRIWLKNAENEK